MMVALSTFSLSCHFGLRCNTLEIEQFNHVAVRAQWVNEMMTDMTANKSVNIGQLGALII